MVLAPGLKDSDQSARSDRLCRGGLVDGDKAFEAILRLWSGLAALRPRQTLAAVTSGWTKTSPSRGDAIVRLSSSSSGEGAADETVSLGGTACLAAEAIRAGQKVTAKAKS
jgi:hypothetical protein